MREILFRGKRIDNGEYMPGSYGDWVYGSYGLKLNVATGEHDEYIMESVYNGATNSSYFVDYKIITGTAGQYTGLTDKDGNKIFEGDKVAFVDFLSGWETECIGEVIFSEYGWHFTNSITESNMHSYEPDDIEIIGNIHDEEE